MTLVAILIMNGTGDDMEGDDARCCEDDKPKGQADVEAARQWLHES